jgi:hypothetical protein
MMIMAQRGYQRGNHLRNLKLFLMQTLEVDQPAEAISLVPMDILIWNMSQTKEGDGEHFEQYDLYVVCNKTFSLTFD